ncbi:radial spoke head 10 homolog B [Cyanocitta cristata]
MPKGKKKDVKKKDAKKDGKKEAGEKSEESIGPTAESSLTTQPDLQNESVSEETQAIPEAPDKEVEVEEPPVQPVPPFHEEPILAQVIIKSYEGEEVDGFYEGEGFICFEGGNTYKGLFSEGHMDGQGTYTWADGVKYEGTFIKNVQMLGGRYTWSDGSVYEGSIKDGLRHGYGFFRSGTRPISYHGDWCNGKRHGKGVIYYDEEHTSWYSGEWVNNVREGQGLRRYRSGNTYVGQWKKNLRHGHGKMTWLAANQEYTGQWVCGIQHGFGSHTWFFKAMHMSQNPLRSEYIGDFVKGERHGRGLFIYPSGATYNGEWAWNKKHGKGVFVSPNGQVFQGEFIDNHPVECPAHQGAAVKAEKQRATGTRRCSGTKKTIIINALGETSILKSDMELDISLLLELLPVEDREEEVKQVELAVLMHISKLKKAYHFYSVLGYDHSPDNTYTLTKLQFWRFLKDCEFPFSSLTLAEMDRLLRGDKSFESIHCPHEVLVFRTFLSYLVHLAFHIYHEEYKDEVPHLCKCFLKMMSRNVLPSACCVQGLLFSGEKFTSFAMSYIDKCWEIYRDFCRPHSRPPFEPTVKMRQFLWMLADFKLLNEQLTASRVVGIFVKVGASLPHISGVNLDLEMVFLEFFEALLECALVYVTEDMILEKAAQDDQKRSSIEIKEFSRKTSAVSLPECSLPQPPRPCEGTQLACLPSLLDEAKEDKDEQDELLSLWRCQMQTFFTTKFFPAFEHEIVLREKIKEVKKEDAELAGLRKIQAEELARLIAEKEEAKRREAAAAEKALAELESVKTLKGKPRRGALPKKDTSRRGPSPKRSLLANKEAPKTEPSS